MFYNHSKKDLMNYEMLIPPLKKPFEELSPDEAKHYFDWHKRQLFSRRKYLQEFSGVDLDYSFSSLVDIWDWFLKNAKTEKTPFLVLLKLKMQLRSQPEDIAAEVLKENSTRFSLETEYIIRDIAMYFGEVCVKNNNGLHWGYYTDDRDSFANMPVIMGFEDRSSDPPFKPCFEPVFIVRTAASCIKDGTAEKEALLKTYNKWLYMIHDQKL